MCLRVVAQTHWVSRESYCSCPHSAISNLKPIEQKHPTQEFKRGCFDTFHRLGFRVSSILLPFSYGIIISKHTGHK